MVLDIIKGLPKGGGYSRGSSFQLPTVTAHNIGGDRWEMRVYDGFPSHCTSATYAVFARLAAVLQNNGSINLTAEQIPALEAKKRMPDGTTLVDGQGPFQIFNANGAGVAAFLKHTGTGMSFRDDKLLYARPGDFLKLFWNENVGASEQGHQVIYLATRPSAAATCSASGAASTRTRRSAAGGTEALYFPAEEGGKVVRRLRRGVPAARRHEGDDLLARHLHGASGGRARRYARQSGRQPRGAPFPFVDDYLYELRKTSSDQATLDRMYDILASPDTLANLTPAAKE